MELPSKILERIAYNTRSRVEQHMLIVLDKYTHEKYLSQPLQTNIKQFKMAITFLSVYNGIFNVTNSNNKIYFQKSIKGNDGYTQITIPPGAYEIESLNNEIKRIIVDQGHYTGENYPFMIKANFITLGSIIEKSTRRTLITFVPGDSVGELLAFNKSISYEEYNRSPDPVDISSFSRM